MGVHINVEAIFLRNTKHFYCKFNPFLVVNAWASVLDSLPSEDVSYGIVTPFSKLRKVHVCIFERKGSVDE